MVSFDRENPPGALKKECSGQATRAGADFEHIAILQFSSLSSDVPGEVEVPNKVLSKRPVWAMSKLLKNFPNRGQSVFQ